jgi:hypothetical protein
MHASDLLQDRPDISMDKSEGVSRSTAAVLVVRLLHASYTPLTRLLPASYMPLARLVHASYTPLARLLHASYTPLPCLLHASYTPQVGDEFMTGEVRESNSHLISSSLRKSGIPCRQVC